MGDAELGAEEMGLMQMEEGAMSIKQIAGVIDSDSVAQFRRLVFRVTKGKSYIYMQEMPEREDVLERAVKEEKQKSIYILIYWSGSFIRDKLNKVCDAFPGRRFDLPALRQIDAEIRDNVS